MIAARNPKVSPRPFWNEASMVSSGIPEPIPTRPHAAISARKACTLNLTINTTIITIAANNTHSNAPLLCIGQPSY